MRLGVPEYNLTVRKKNIFNQNVPDSCGAATTVQQEIDNDPVAIFAEITACCRLFQQLQQFFVRIGFLDCFDLFIVWNIQCRIALPGTLIQEGAEHPQIAADGVVRQPALPH